MTVTDIICSNRTIVGLKLISWVIQIQRSSTQQSHHCGIETGSGLRGGYKFGVQQSHHCGIETGFPTTRWLGLTAAIAPLWD